MQDQKQFPWLPATAIAALVTAMAALAPVLPTYIALQSPDSPPYTNIAWKSANLNGLLNHQARAFSLDSLLLLALPNLAYHDWSYILHAVLLALAVGSYLRFLRLPPVACLAGGLCMAFSGYHFTLFNAGHRGYFIMMPYIVFLFTLIDRAAFKPRPAVFALMAVCLVYGVSYQPDVAMLLLIVAALYALMRIAQSLRSASGPERRSKLRAWGLGAAVGMLVLAIAGSSTLKTQLGGALDSRARQLAEAAQTPAAASDPAAAEQAAWIFATNWSLPFEAIAEFIAPNLRGYESYNETAPYWGTLGQSHEWRPGAAGFVNFRQHSLYIGAIPLLLALFALLSAARRKPAETRENQAAGTDAAEFNRTRSATFFWTATAVVALILSLGRHTPFYKIAYSAPFLSQLRAPVKYLHVTELAVSILAAIGLATLLGQFHKKRSSLKLPLIIATAAAVTLALVCIFAAVLAPLEGGPMTERLAALDLARFEPRLRALYGEALLRGAALSALAATLFGLAAFLPKTLSARQLQLLGVAIAVTIAADLATSARPYVNSVDLSYLRISNPIADILQASGGPDGMTLGNRLAPMHSKTPLLWSISNQGYSISDSPADHPPDSLTRKSARHFGGDARKQWLFWGTRAVLIPPSEVARFDSDAEFSAIGTYAYNGRQLFPAPPDKANVGAVAFRSWIPTAAFYTRWRSVEPDRVWQTLADPELDLQREAVLADGPTCPADAPARPTRGAKLILPPSRAKWRRAIVEIETDQPGIVVLREMFALPPRVNAKVNGVKTEAYPANRYFWAVPVQAGLNRIEFAQDLHWWRLPLHLAGLLIGFASLARLRSRA